MAIRLGSVSLVGIILESVHYGVFFVLFVYNMYLQWRNYGEGSSNRPNVVLLIASTLLFCLITAHWCLNVARLYEAVITVAHNVPIDLYFANLPDPKQVAATGLFDLEILTGDFILIYRLYHVYQSNWWVCIIPTGSWTAMVVSLGFLLKAMSSVSLATGVFIQQVKRWISASFCLTLTTNVYCTALIVLRLWRGQRTASRIGSSTVKQVLRIFVESAALLTIYVLGTFITFQLGNTVQYALLDVVGPAAGISFMLILVRLNWRKTGQGTSQFTSGSGFDANSRMHASDRYPMSPINVDVSRNINMDSDSLKASKHSIGMA